MSEYDVVVVGGGPAGLSATLMLVRARRRVLVVDAGSPRNAPARHLHGFLGHDGQSPTELLAAARHEVQHYGARVVDGRVSAIEKAGDGFVVQVAGAPSVRTRTVVVATGLTDDLPDVPGLAERWGRDVLHCPYCHGWEVRGRRLGVLGQDPGAAHQAQLLRQWSDDVTLFLPTGDGLSSGDRARLAARGIELVVGVVDRVEVSDGGVSGVRLADGRLVSRDVIFVGPRVSCPDQLLSRLGVATDSHPTASWAVSDDSGLTQVPGVWVAGNVADPAAQVVDAAASGAQAGVAVNGYLVERDVAEALALHPTSHERPA